MATPRLDEVKPYCSLYFENISGVFCNDIFGELSVIKVPKIRIIPHQYE